MYCVKCGTKIDDDSKFCVACGAEQKPSDKKYEGAEMDIDMGNKQSEVVEEKTVDTVNTGASAQKKKSRMPAIVLALILCLGCVYFFSNGAFSKEPCDWCGSTPTKAYKIDKNDISYVCKKCSSRCLYCGKKATKHAPNLFHMMVFMCDDCYKQMASYQ